MSLKETHPYQINFNQDRYYLIKDMIEWCYENIGESYHKFNDPWRFSTAFGKSTFAFQNNEDAVRFALKWA